MSYEKKNRKFIAKPIFEGGEKELNKYIYQHLKYPREHLTDKKEGIVEIKIDISSKGKVIGTRILKSIGKAFDREAELVMKKLRFTIPNAGGRNGKVIFHRTMKVKFVAPKEKVVQQLVGYNITLSKTKPTKGTPTATPKKSYGYTINIE